MADRPRLVLALEHRLLSDALATALTEAGFDVVVWDLRDLSLLGRSMSGCTVLLDVNRLDQVDGLWNSAPAARVLAQASHTDDETVARVLARGGSGVVGLDASLDEIQQAIVTVSHGSTVVSGAALKQLVEEGSTPERHARPGHLTDRETSILARLATGASTREIAADMGITENTARRHIQNILGKLGVHSRLEASALAARQGFS